jgi:hypothetical protein
MGNICLSSNNQEYFIKQQMLEAEALKRFNIRVNSYSYPHHGPYIQYIEWCRAQYELDCIPPSCRQGPNYRERDYEY